MSYRDDKLAAARGFNTWDVYSALTHVCMPQGYGIRFGLKDGRSGQYLSYINPGDEKDGAVFTPGAHAPDGSYTEAQLSWRRVTIRIRTAVLGTGDFLARVDLISNESKFPPELVVEGVDLWNCGNIPMKDGRSLRFLCADGAERTAHIVTGTEADDRYLPLSCPYVCLSLEKPVRVSVGQYFAADDLDAMLDARESAFYADCEKAYGEYGEAALDARSSLAWNLIYDPGYRRPMFVSSRRGSAENGGFLLSGWDGFFMGMLLAKDDPALARVCVHAQLGGAAVLGFVSGESAGRGVALGRSMPPVGGICLAEIYRITQDREFAEECFELLLEWNRWWEAQRKNGECLAYGCDPFADLRTAEKIDGRSGALLESGDPDSPLYAEENAAYDEKRDLFALHDAGLTALYAADCACLAFLASELGKKDEEAELSARGAQYKAALSALWDDEDAIYRNFRTDTGAFSSALSPACLYPLLCSAPTTAQAERMTERHLSVLSENAPEYVRLLLALGLRNYGMEDRLDAKKNWPTLF
ncbi:MAG: hypothetical protein IIZ49_00380 [Oscillospiraceae bacterium]|nr:hypothetical protein [Oscillospiraceae bacterium]